MNINFIIRNSSGMDQVVTIPRVAAGKFRKLVESKGLRIVGIRQ